MKTLEGPDLVALALILGITACILMGHDGTLVKALSIVAILYMGQRGYRQIKLRRRK